MVAPSPHKPRRKTKKAGSDVSSAVGSSARSGQHGRSTRSGNKPAYPLEAFLWSARGPTSQWEMLPLILMAVGLFRWAAGLWGYSGFQNPPMHGDYEAQRHWMEITTQLPISQWYFHDLEWWGLDYPPLTAYHSWLLGKIGGFINPNWFELYGSRGTDDPTLKIFMRATVIISEYLIYVPAAVIFLRRSTRFHGVHAWDSSIALVAVLMQPALILIDHVHFQYNTVMLGLALAFMSSMMASRYLWGCVFFVAALGFKQMALYYAPAVFAYLLGVCIFPSINIPRFLGIAIITAISFGILLAPILLGSVYDTYRGIHSRPEVEHSKAPLPIFGQYTSNVDPYAWYYPPLEQLSQIIFRVFPFARGLFEDKVANFWCALNTIIKLKVYDPVLLQRASLLATLGAIAPPCTIIFFKPRKELLSLALASCAWAFFLFSFQVHEKSALLPLMPMTVLLGAEDGLSRYTRAWVGFANLLGLWTMFPLLSRVDLRVPYTVLTLLWAYLLGLPPTSLDAYKGMSESWLGIGTSVVHGGFYVAMIIWHGAEAFVTPPTNLPDLFAVTNACIGAVGFGICYMWCIGTLSGQSGLFGGGNGRVVEKRKTKTL